MFPTLHIIEYLSYINVHICMYFVYKSKINSLKDIKPEIQSKVKRYKYYFTYSIFQGRQV